jgi:2-polyprenyl-3-methyl-5-hydroxy-6-metoxy-1,4-benzoquinol methylase
MDHLENIKNIFQKGTWYHTVEFENFKSKGTFDYTELVKELNFPDMEGLKILDVGCSDGFFSQYFLQELNASHVTGIDFNNYDGSIAFDVLSSKKNQYAEKYESHNDFIDLKDDYKKLGLSNSNKFTLLKKINNLNMDYFTGSIYDLSDFETSDVSFCGSLLEHLRDPITAIEQLYFKTTEFCLIDISNTFKSSIFSKKKPYLEYTGAGGNFFHYTSESIKLMMETIGFRDVSVLKDYKIKIEKYNYKIDHSVIIGYK